MGRTSTPKSLEQWLTKVFGLPTSLTMRHTTGLPSEGCYHHFQIAGGVSLGFRAGVKMGPISMGTEGISKRRAPKRKGKKVEFNILYLSQKSIDAVIIGKIWISLVYCHLFYSDILFWNIDVWTVSEANYISHQCHGPPSQGAGFLSKLLTCAFDSPEDPIPPSPNAHSHTPIPRAIITTHMGQMPNTVTSYVLCFMCFCESAPLIKPVLSLEFSPANNWEIWGKLLGLCEFHFPLLWKPVLCGCVKEWKVKFVQAWYMAGYQEIVGLLMPFLHPWPILKGRQSRPLL